MADQHLILERRRKQNKSSKQQGVGEAQVISPVTSFPFNQKPFLSVVSDNLSLLPIANIVIKVQKKSGSSLYSISKSRC